MSILSISQDDVRRYMTCPKIVSAYAYKEKNKPPTVRQKRPDTAKSPNAIGKVGELATLAALSGNEAQDAAWDRASADGRLGTYAAESVDIGRSMDAYMEGILKKTASGLDRIRASLKEEYGKISILGKGMSKNGILCSTAEPDYLAMMGGKLVMLEVKTTEKMLPSHDFQAEFYNFVGSRFGVSVMDGTMRVDPGEGLRMSVPPVAVEQKVAETILIYPPLGVYKTVTGSVDIDANTVLDIWRAKELGACGLSPETDCDSGCRHHKHQILPEDTLEVVQPLALMHAHGMVEQGADLDAMYNYDHLQKNMKELVSGIRHLHGRAFGQKEPPADADSLLDIVSEKTGLSREKLDQISRMRGRDKEEEERMHRAAKREMAEGYEKWGKIYGTKGLEKLERGGSIKRHSSKVFRLPSGSKPFVRKSWKVW